MKVAIVYVRANIDTVPCLVGAAELLAEAGYDVDVFTYLQAGQPAPTFESPRIRVRSLGVDGLADRSTLGLRRLVKRAGWLPGVARAPLARGYQAFGAGLARGSRIAARARNVLADGVGGAADRARNVLADGVGGAADRARNVLADGAGRAIGVRYQNYACVIGVDPDGLALARTLAPGVPLGYYSLELLLSYEVSTASEIQLKARERELCQQAAFVIVQDADRGQLLADDNAIGWDRIALVPNAPMGPARRKLSRWWHTRFDLPADARVVIHSGSLGDWTGIGAIVESAASWPRPWVLVVHTRYDAESSAYVDQLQRRADPKRVRFSLKPVPRQDYDNLIDAADLGLAFYVATGESSFTQRNIQTIGLSSGKLAYYLRAGLPVIVNRDASVAQLIDSAACGVSVTGADAIGTALEHVAADYDGFRARALTFFDQQLDFRRAFTDVVARVDALR